MQCITIILLHGDIDFKRNLEIIIRNKESNAAFGPDHRWYTLCNKHDHRDIDNLRAEREAVHH